MIEKKFKKFNLKQKIKLFNHLDTKFLIINLFLQFLIVSFSIIGSLYLTKYIGNFQTNNSFETSIWVCVFFLFIFTIENLVKYISSLLISKQIRNNCFFYSSNILKNISIKGSNFFNKIDKNYYYFIDKIIIGISSFNVITVINFIGTCFSLFLIFFIFSYISIFYTFICIFSMIIFFIFELLKYKFKLKTLRNGMKTNIDFYENGREIVEIINGYSNIYQNQKIQQDFKNN
jgi:ABC-type bacteriocin/lantibiotic exporter with double-glycine peptidase domain